MIREIILMPRADSGYNFGVSSWVFKDDESEIEAKTNSRHRVCPLLVVSPFLECAEHAQCPLLACCVSARTLTHSHSHSLTHTHTHTHTYIYTHTHTPSPPRADPNFLTHFTAKGGPSIFEWSTLSM